MPLPDFIGIGAQRSGSSWLYDLLKLHPEICTARHRKEVHYFDKYYHRGEDWYRSLFDHCKGKCAGEITPAYIYDDRCAERIYGLVPEAKLIAILRNPIYRAYSQFKFTIRDEGYKGSSFTEFMEGHKDVIERGLYYKQISRYLDYFPRGNLKILFFEEMVADPDKGISEVFDFLGVDTSFTPDRTQEKVNYSQVPRFHGLYVITKKIALRLHNSDLSWAIAGLKIIGVKNQFLPKLGDRIAFPKLTEREYDYLKRYYEEDVKELSSLLNSDLKTLWGFDI